MWWIRFHRRFLLRLFPLSILPLLPQVPLHCKVSDIFRLLFRTFVLFCFAPFYPPENQQIDRAKHKYSANGLQRALLRKQQAVDLYFLLHSTGMQQIQPAVPWRVLAQWNHFVQWCSGLAPNFLSPKLPYAWYWRAQLADGCIVPFPPHPSPRHVLSSLSHLWRRNILSVILCWFWTPCISISKHKVSLCPLCLVVGLQCCIIQNTYSAFLAWLSDPLFTLTFSSSSCVGNCKFSPVHSSSFSSIPNFSWNFHLFELAVALQLF